MCQLCEQLGLDLHKFTTIEAGDSGSLRATTASWAASPLDGGSGPTGQNPLTDTVPGSTSTSFSMSSGTSVRGYVNSGGEQDWYSVTLVAGQTYTFALSGFGQGALSDAYLQLFNASGTEIAFDDDNGPLWNSLLTFTASTSGTYYVSAGGYGSITGQYLLTMNAGTTPYAPVVSVGDVADYLTNSYWEVNGSVAHHWGTASVTFNVQGLEPERAALARIAFQVWSEVANLTFVETTGAAQIMLDDTQPGAYASSSYDGNGIITSANINVATNWYGGIDAVDSYTLQTFIHEIGHAIGLGHGGPYNGSATYGVDNTYANDTWQLSLMSYMDQADYGSASYRFTMTPMMADILAVQNLYGAAATRTGDTVYGFGSTAGSLYDFSTYAQAPALTIYDSGGVDTLNASGYSQNQIINLTGGSFSNIGGLVGNVGIYTTAVIENAVGGSGNDTITGNAVANVLTGGGGNDTLYGLDGNDTLIGGAGNDTVTGGSDADWFVFSAPSSGIDTITDFAAGSDKFVLDRNGFGLSATGSLQAAGVSFVSGSVAQSAGPTILSSGSDIYWDSDGTGSSAPVLLAHAPAMSIAHTSVTVGPMSGWNALGTGHFKGDGTEDILWQRGHDGFTATWEITNGNVSGAHLIGMLPGWSLAAIGDINNDGTDDVIWQRGHDGFVGAWFIQNGAVAGTAYLGMMQGWKAAAHGDFNGDGSEDIAWQRASDGFTQTWLMSNGTVASTVPIGPIPGWDVVTTGHFNTDGTDDILLRRASDGFTASWEMTNGNVSGAHLIGMLPGWDLVSHSDLNNDGTDDVTWQRASDGFVATWLISNGAITSAIFQGMMPGWKATANGDFNNDGTDDILWQRSSDGATTAWLMSNSTVGASVSLGAMAGWSPVTSGQLDSGVADDLMWRRPDGVIESWLHNGYQMTAQDWLVV